MNPSKFFIYCRKSTESEDRQILSLDAQLSELNAIARKNGISIVGTFTESKSAKEPGREIFNAMLRRIEKGEANGILTWKLDRLARNFDDGGKVIGLLQRGIIQEIRTFEKSYLPSDNVLLIAVELGMANQYVRDLSVNIRRGIREKVRRGIYCWYAPTGYLNDPKLRTIEPDPESFYKLKSLFEKFATGRYTLAAIQRESFAMGLIGKYGKKPLRINSITHLFRNPFYYGVFLCKGEMHQGIHVPMISKQTFDDIQKALILVGKPRKDKRDKGFRFLRFATCGSCGHCITAERHIKPSGRCFHYYRCTHKNKKQHCEGRSYIREERFAVEVKRNAELITIPDIWKKRFLARIATWETEASEGSKKQINSIKKDLVIINSRIDRINDAFTDGTIEIAEYKELKNPLIAKKVDFEQQIRGFEARRGDGTKLEPEKQLKTWIFEANRILKWVKNDDFFALKRLLNGVGSNRLLRAQTLTVSFKKPWNYLAKTNVAVLGTEPVSAKCSMWWTHTEIHRTV